MIQDMNHESFTYFTLPLIKPIYLSEDSVKRNGVKINLTEINWKKVTLLVAEDEDDNFFLIEEILEPTKIKLVRAKNGKEAIDILKKQPEIRLVLMDIKMPVMNGYEATMHIKDFWPEVKVIAQTAFALSDDQSRGYNAGCDSFIPKPIKGNELIEEIARYIS